MAGDRHDTPHHAEPRISWFEDFDTGDMKCQVRVPRQWLIETSELKRKFVLWWWLTKLAWSLPK